MVDFYYFLVLLNAVFALIVAVQAYRKNFRERVGVLVGGAILLMACWLYGFSYYFRALEKEQALLWGKVTLSLGVINTPVFFHAIYAFMRPQRPYRWLVVSCYATGLLCIALIWGNRIIIGLKYPPYMDHYLRYNRAWYPFLIAHIAGWQWVVAFFLLFRARREVGYMRAQLSYFAAAWFVVFLTTSFIIAPMEYDINIQPFGFFIMPLNLMMLGYVMSKARLADVNVVIARGLLYTVTLIVVAVLCLLFVGGVTLLLPGFLNAPQVLFIVALVLVIGLALTVTLPKFLPRAEQFVQEHFFSGRSDYHEVLSELVKELSRASSLDQMLQTVATTIHSNMQVSRVLFFLQDPVADEFRLHAQSGMDPKALPDGVTLTSRNLSIRWLAEHKDALVRDEMARVLPPSAWSEMGKEFERLGVALYVPMLLDDRLVGVIALGEKLNREMFYVSDLRLLGTLATEVALGVRYRRMEEHVIRNNKLVELGTIAAGIAHEIRNPLSSIRTFAQLLPTQADDPEFRSQYSKRVVQDVDRISQVIQSVLSFARPGTVSIGTHQATAMVKEALTLVQPRLKGKNIMVTTQFHQDPSLRVDRQKIIQVLVNLLNNAIDAVPTGGHIRIVTGMHRVEVAKGQTGQPFGVIEISDNGPGIPVAIRSRLFDPFFTTKKDGTGLGLSISQKIVRDHNGMIAVSSVEGRGATFQVYLPVA